MHDDDETPDPYLDARVAETKRIRALPVSDFVDHLSDLVSRGREASALTFLYDQLFEYLDASNRNIPRLKEIVALILDKIHSPSFLRGLDFFLKTPARFAESRELIELIAERSNKRMYDALMVPVTDPQTGLTSIHPAGSEAALLRPLK